MVIDYTLEYMETLKDNKLLTQWERDFVVSVASQFAKSGKLSTAQRNVLDRCAEKTSSDKVKERNDWIAAYDEEKRRIATLCANYYKREGYFTQLCENILNDVGFIPSKEQYEKMCENKYAKKVIEADKTEPEFQAGDLAIIRSGIRRSSFVDLGVRPTIDLYRDYTKLINQVVVILEYDNSRPRTGKMVTFCLLTDPSAKFTGDEKFLKKTRGKK